MYRSRTKERSNFFPLESRNSNGKKKVETCIYIYIYSWNLLLFPSILACNRSTVYTRSSLRNSLGGLLPLGGGGALTNEDKGERFILDSTRIHTPRLKAEGWSGAGRIISIRASDVPFVFDRHAIAVAERKLATVKDESPRGQSKLDDVVNHTRANSRYITGITNAFSPHYVLLCLPSPPPSKSVDVWFRSLNFPVTAGMFFLSSENICAFSRSNFFSPPHWLLFRFARVSSSSNKERFVTKLRI